MRGLAGLGLMGLLAAGQSLSAAPLLVNESDPEVRAERVMSSNAWLEIDTQAFDFNLKEAQRFLAGRAQLCAIMKADAYGHGIDGLMPTVLANGVRFIGIASNEEARMVRAHGFTGRIIRVRSAALPEVEGGVAYGIEELVGSLEQAQQIAVLSAQRETPIGVHLALNSTGMGRNGLELGTEQGQRDGLAIVRTPGLKVVGMMTHFPRSDEDYIQAAVQRFDEQTQWLIARAELKRDALILHAASSYATLHVPEAHFDLVRLGGLIYGRSEPYRKMATFKTRIASLHRFPAGSTIGYSGTAVLTRDSVLANLPIGYSDGFARSLSNRGYVLINGQRARVVGTTSMNTTMVDVTDIPTVQANDEVVLFGAQGKEVIDSDVNRALSERSLGEQSTLWGAANPRLYF